MVEVVKVVKESVETSKTKVVGCFLVMRSAWKERASLKSIRG